MNPSTRPVRALTRRAALAGAAQALALLAAACAPIPAPSAPTGPPAAPSAPPTPTAPPTPAAACLGNLGRVVPPTPIPYPGYVQVEPSTGLHVTAEPRLVDLPSYRLEIKGKVARELALTFDEIRCLPKVSAEVQIVCPGYFIDQSNLAGASLAAALEQAAPLPEAQRALFVGVDGRAETLDLSVARAADAFLAYEWEGEWLPISHGFPIRLALPGHMGGSWVKWLKEISIV
jgi:DMSO/TMAO reductase YedYZ molybdopterin-dependent catalytic subunit